jgi:osmotically-inducible protein OsmY
MKRWSFACGVMTGIGLMFFLDPDRGGRRRALVRDKAVRASRKTSEVTRGLSRDASNRLRGVAAEARGLVRGDYPTDEVLAERVRSAIGRATSHPHAIDVQAYGRHVTLEGPVLAHEMPRVLRAARRVRGVADVENRLDPHAEPGDVPSLQSGAPRIRRSEHPAG